MSTETGSLQLIFYGNCCDYSCQAKKRIYSLEKLITMYKGEQMVKIV